MGDWLIRAIYRFDFPLNYEIMNRPGEVAKILDATTPNFWADILEERGSARRLTAQIHQPGRFANLNVEPGTVNGTIQSMGGFAWEEFLENQHLKAISEIVDRTCKVFEITKINRGGFRMNVVRREDDRESGLESFMKYLDQPRLKAFRDAFGAVEDLGITIQGQLPSMLFYRLTFGPGGADDVVRFSPDVRHRIQTEPKLHYLAADIDIYEKTFVFSAQSGFHRWIRPKWQAAESFLRQLGA